MAWNRVPGLIPLGGAMSFGGLIEIGWEYRVSLEVTNLNGWNGPWRLGVHCSCLDVMGEWRKQALDFFSYLCFPALLVEREKKAKGMKESYKILACLTLFHFLAPVLSSSFSFFFKLLFIVFFIKDLPPQDTWMFIIRVGDSMFLILFPLCPILHFYFPFFLSLASCSCSFNRYLSYVSY